jgi:hypothetical protein
MKALKKLEKYLPKNRLKDTPNTILTRQAEGQQKQNKELQDSLLSMVKNKR